ncbi:S-adenosyl-L-methionine-dependent methyltransferase [Choiromyces venosus 120613-1]|uniref:tRNA (adenine(58)-N(1))-methyltransferase catalytic subunit TRM61 n=1 Tax=Choiromyces venosus 120613-1 TaxID=1336337 RepID=A0A3N4J5D1_9PEZI|nr:S-adenosyl-L-methionine-dependent methyltransferase [Choiromyces venosus 120613-1]
MALLRPVTDPTKTCLTRPLTPHTTFDTYRGKISHNDIIGKQARDIVTTPKGVKFRIAFPTLEEYIVFVRRLVTPVYPVDAATIVSLLDIHVVPNDRNAEEQEPVEVLEAGTGHGSLTLYLSRALSPSPRAVLHTMDISPSHSAHAQKVVANFRRGIYLPNVRFNVSDPGTWCREQFSLRKGKPFLTHAILDLPGPDEYLFDVMRCLKPDGVVGVWCPSVSQIMVSVGKVKGSGLFCERVLEFPGGTGVGAGLRAWDVRPALIRAKLKKEVEVVAELTPPVSSPSEVLSEKAPVSEAFVCRPTVGDRLVGGGFFAMFRRKSEDDCNHSTTTAV